MKLAFVILSEQGYVLARRIAGGFPSAHFYVHRQALLHKECKVTPFERLPEEQNVTPFERLPEEQNVTPFERLPEEQNVTPFERIVELTKRIFFVYDGLIYVTACGIAVRAIAGMLQHKTKDPAVVVVDLGGRHAISLLSGHEGGANQLAFGVANQIGAEPVITTASEAAKPLIVGVGCRKNTASIKIIDAVLGSLEKIQQPLERVRLLTSVDLKQREEGLKEAARSLEVPLLFIPSDVIRTYAGAFDSSDFVLKNVNLPAVAEPCALLAGKRTRIILPKTTWNGITIAIAQESFLWSE